MAQRFTLNGFKGGIDKRNTELTSPPGTLVSLNNGHINQGGEIEKRKALFAMYDQKFIMSGQVYGLNAQSGGFVVHGSSATPTLAGNSATNRASIALQIVATLLYKAAGYSVTYASGSDTVSFINTNGGNITLVNTGTTTVGNLTITNSGTPNPTVVVSGSWADGDTAKLTFTVNAVVTVVEFTTSAMQTMSFTTTNIAAQLGAALKVTWPAGTGMTVSVSANVITLNNAGALTVVNAGSVTAAGTLTVGGSPGTTVTITVGGTWLASDLASIEVVLAGGTRFSAIVVEYASMGFNALAVSGGSGTCPPVSYQRLNPPTLGLSSPTLSAIVESCSFLDRTFAIATFSDNYNYLYYNGAVVPNSFVGYVYSYMVDATASTTRANILKQFGYANAGSILSLDIVGAANTIVFNQGLAPGTISEIVVESYSTSTGSATVSGVNVVLAGQWAAGDWIKITVVDSLGNTYQYGYGNVTALQAPVFCLPYKNKVYVLDNINGGKLNFSKVGDAKIFNDPEQTGTGQISLTQSSNITDALVTACPYQGWVAIFFRSSIQIWSLQDDPAENNLVQTFLNIGCVSKRAAVPIGQLDVVFLSDSGFRSLRVRDASNNALVVDVGSPVDGDVTDVLRQYNLASSTQYTFNVIGGYEPIENRIIFLFYYLVNGAYNLIGVWTLSYYPEERIQAWCTYSWITYLQGSGVSSSLMGLKFITWKSALYCQGGPSTFDGLTVYDPTLVGRTAYNACWDQSQVTMETPWYDAKHMELVKDSEAVDVVMEGWWQVESGTDPRGSTATQVTVPYAIATPTPSTAVDSTFGQGSFSIRLRGTHLKLKVYTKPTYTGKARLAAYTQLYQIEEQK